MALILLRKHSHPTTIPRLSIFWRDFIFRLEGTTFSDTQYVEYRILKTITIMKGELDDQLMSLCNWTSNLRKRVSVGFCALSSV